jgi:hypothetical protein
MCSTPKTPEPVQAETKTVATPTYADASVTKASTNTRNKTASMASRNIKTTARGLVDNAAIQKKGLLGE